MAAYNSFTVPIVPIVRYEKLGGGAVMYFKMRGWDPLVEDWEVWINVAVPTEDNNPSGHALEDVTIVDTWVTG